MSKRCSPKTQSTPKTKRTKIAKDQPLIHQFFSSPKKKPESSVPISHSNPSSPRSESVIGSSPVFIDVDALDDSKESFPVAGTSETVSLIPPTGSSSRQELVVSKHASPDRLLAYDDLTYDPASKRNIQKPWPSTSVPYSFLAHALSTLTQTRSRITISRVLTNCLYMIIRYDPTSLLPAMYLLSNTLAPPYSSLELGLGPSIISRSIQHVSGLTPSALKRLYNSTGDAGDVAFAAKSNLRTLLPHPPLHVDFVYASLLTIARSRGQGTAKEKEKIVQKLLLAAAGEEVRFLTRTLSQNLRVGAVRTTILSALARAMVLVPATRFIDPTKMSLHASSDVIEEQEHGSGTEAGTQDHAELTAKFELAESLVKRVYVQHPNYDDITSALLQAGLDGLQERVYLTIGIPLLPTLGSPTRSLEDVYEIMQNRPFIAEFKYDGQRAQIHGVIEGEKIMISLFSRHLEDMTTKYPDVVHLVKAFFHDHPETTSFILDAEIVPIDPDGKLKSFQDLSNRARKDVQLQDVRVLVSVFAFDLMYLNGEALLERTFQERRDLLLSRFPAFISPNRQLARFNHVESCSSIEGRDAIEAFWERAIESRCEGLMVKILDHEPKTEATKCDKSLKSRRKQLPATYEPDKRTSAWLKLKKDYVTGLGDTLDLIPIGAWHGNGRKAQWWSPILLGLWQPDSGRIVAVCKCMSGFTDVFYKELAERYQLSETPGTCSRQSLWDCDVGALNPEVYFKPSEVWEIRGADITISPVSVAAKGLVSASRGLSLRFPRFLRMRKDKTIEHASTPEFLAKMWRDQEKRGMAQDGNDEGDLIDVELDAPSESSSEAEASFED